MVKMISIRDASQVLGVSHQRTHQLVVDGTLRSEKRGRLRFVAKADVTAYARKGARRAAKTATITD